MDNLETNSASHRPARWLALLPVVLLAAAWALYFIGRQDTYARALSVHHHDLDMADTFRREGYAARLFLPFMATVMVLDILAWAALIYARGKDLSAGWWGTAVTIAIVLTFLLHGLGLLGTLFLRISIAATTM